MQKLNCDVFNISNRIKNIDSGYFIVFNTSKQKFEVHCKNQIGSTYCLTLPFNQLDERTLTYVQQTQSINLENILNQIETENKKIKSANISSTLNDIHNNLEYLRS